MDHVAVSGVGRRSNNDDEIFGIAPDDPKKRYDDDTGPGTTIDVALTPSRPTIFTRSLDEDVSALGLWISRILLEYLHKVFHPEPGPLICGVFVHANWSRSLPELGS